MIFSSVLPLVLLAGGYALLDFKHASYLLILAIILAPALLVIWKINRKLEETVAERTRALEASNAAAREQAGQNARLLEAECAQRKLAEALVAVTATLTSKLELDEVFEGILSNLGQVVAHDAAIIMLIENDVIRPVRWHGMPESFSEACKNWRYSIHDLHNRKIMLNTVQTIVIPDTRLDPYWVRTCGMEWIQSYAGAPICQRGEVTGFIDVMSAQPNYYNAEIGPILQAFANQAAIALENARLYHNTQQRMAETSALYRAVQPLFSPADNLDELARQITASVTKEFSSAHCSLLLVNEDRTRLLLVAQSGSLHLDSPELPLDGPGLTVAAARCGRPIYSPDVWQDPNYVLGASASRSELAIPMYASEQVIGVLNLESPEIDAFDQRSQRLLASFAEQAALGLENARLFATIRQNATQMAKLHEVAQRRAQENARLYESAQQHARELEALHVATTSLVTTLDLEKLLERILVSATRAIPTARAAALHLLDGSGQMHLRVQHGLDENEVQSAEWNAGNSLRSRVLQQRQPALVSSAQVIAGQGPAGEAPAGEAPVSEAPVSETPVGETPGDEPGDALLIAPLLQDGQPLGLITLISPERDAFIESDLHLLISFASTATAAIHNAQLHSAVQHLAITDPLTGIYNRRGFYSLAQQLLEQAELYHLPLSAIMIDVDYFKKINDRYGHDAGDVVLQALAQRCRSVLRDSDLICRYGGEEFAILLAESDLAGAQGVARRIFKCITETGMETAAGQVQVTISVGVAAYEDGCDSLDHLLKRADQALYLAKDRGRNQVQSWREELR